VTKNLTLSLLRATALIVVLAGALASLSFMLYAGRSQSSVILIMLFVAWVLSPFVALLVAGAVSKSRRVLMPKTLYILMIVLALGSLVGYSGILSPPGTKPAFVFLVVPLISWLIIAIFIPATRFLSRRAN